MADLWLIARDRTTRLTDAETVRLGRVLLAESSTSRIWFPDDHRPVVVVRDCGKNLPARVRDRVTEILGPFDGEVRPPTHRGRSAREQRVKRSTVMGPVADDRRYWFKAKSFGYGWGLPATREGWTVFIGFLVLVIGAVVTLSEAGAAVAVGVLGAGLTAVCYAKGEPPKWRWGRRS